MVEKKSKKKETPSKKKKTSSKKKETSSVENRIDKNLEGYIEPTVIPYKKPQNNFREKEMKIDIMYFPKKNVHYNNMTSPFKMFDLFRNIQKPMSLERLTYEEIKITNRLLREILLMIKK